MKKIKFVLSGCCPPKAALIDYIREFIRIGLVQEEKKWK